MMTEDFVFYFRRELISESFDPDMFTHFSETAEVVACRAETTISLNQEPIMGSCLNSSRVVL